MEVAVSALTARAPAVVLRPAQDELTERPCSVCGRGDDSRLLTEVVGDEGPSLRVSLCTACEHLYLSRLPTTAWYQRYYADTWDAPRSVPGRLARVRYRLGTARLRARRVVARTRARTVFAQDVAGDVQPMQVFPMLLGVVEDSGAYHASPDVEKVLELGAGYGRVLEVFARRGFTAVGTEASPPRAAACRARGLDVVDTPVDSLEPVESRAPFDLAYSLHVLEHVTDPLGHVAAVARLLRPNAFLYVQVPYALHEANVLHRAHSAVHCDSYTPRSLCTLLHRAGFVVLRVQVDNNLQVLAQRAERASGAYGPLPAYAETLPLADLAPPLAAAAAAAPSRLRATWDHAFLELRRVDDGASVFERRVHANVDRIEPAPNELELVVEEAEPLWPVRFAHRGPAPVLAKA